MQPSTQGVTWTATKLTNLHSRVTSGVTRHCAASRRGRGFFEFLSFSEPRAPRSSLRVASLVVPSGYVHCSQKTIIRLLARQTRLPGATDNTRYGEGRASPRSFLMHHVANILANISTAIQAADAQTILNAASAHKCSVSHMGSCKVCVF